jgi:hypothetical protein
MSMQEFLRTELEQMAARPTVDQWLAQVRKRKGATRTHVPPRDIIAARNADRR